MTFFYYIELIEVVIIYNYYPTYAISQMLRMSETAIAFISFNIIMEEFDFARH